MTELQPEFNGIIGYEEIKIIAEELTTIDSNVLILGETGVGKNLFAQYIHCAGNRSSKEFVTVDCPSICSTLFESELFGHTKGSFTDAREDIKGLVSKANQGTLFFDEIGEISTDYQVKLLRLVEEKHFKRIGSNKEEKVKARMIFSTNRNLRESVKKELFRNDLYYRISTHILEIPPLRERRNDVAVIAQAYWAKLHKVKNYAQLSNEEVALLKSYDFPGNIRELINILERTAISANNFEPDERIHVLEKQIKKSSLCFSSPIIPKDKIIDMMLSAMINQHKSFWEAVHKRYIDREINKAQLCEVLSKGLELTRGGLKSLQSLFNIKRVDYKRFVDFVRHQQLTKKLQTDYEEKKPTS